MEDVKFTTDEIEFMAQLIVNERDNFEVVGDWYLVNWSEGILSKLAKLSDGINDSDKSQ